MKFPKIKRLGIVLAIMIKYILQLLGYAKTISVGHGAQKQQSHLVSENGYKSI